MQPDDRNFILATWLRCFRQSPFTKHIPNDIFFDMHQQVIERFWKRPTAKTKIACLEDDENVIMGYLAFENTRPETLHFCYVKETLQGEGVARELFKQSGIDLNEVHHFTHFTKDMETVSVKYRTLRYSPYFL